MSRYAGTEEEARVARSPSVGPFSVEPSVFHSVDPEIVCHIQPDPR